MADSGRALGTVTTWDAADGGGVIESADLPGGCWAAADAVEGPDAPTLRTGQVVEVTWRAPGDHGYPFRAVRVAPRPNLQETPGA